ncbi:unnamed protein product [Lymnaea stagnalis]|uniref:Uncharacterized protein n=1 Tax=Lymnaea stagnalis TaxID=6523 RepID=A0AAV2HK57_LYMST
MGACKPNTESCRAEHVKPSDVEMLRTAVKAKDIPRSRIYSCRILAPFTNCIRTGLIECNPNYEKLLDYELAKFGGVCLASMNIQSPLVALGKCHPQYSNWMQRASARSLVWTWCSLLASTLISFLGASWRCHW